MVVELTGGNDCLNTVVPYEDELYYDNRPTVHHKQDEVLKLGDRLGLSLHMGPIKRLWNDGNVVVINGIGYPEPNRSHFRAMDIWHAAEPTKVIGEGWLGRAIRDLDPSSENVLTGLNLGRGPPSREQTSSGRPLRAMIQKWSMGDPFAQRLRDTAQVVCADLGTYIYYAQHGSFATPMGRASRSQQAVARGLHSDWRLRG